jgi:hypothetical protein
VFAACSAFPHAVGFRHRRRPGAARVASGELVIINVLEILLKRLLGHCGIKERTNEFRAEISEPDSTVVVEYRSARMTQMVQARWRVKISSSSEVEAALTADHPTLPNARLLVTSR